jgi:hypothetical protein
MSCRKQAAGDGALIVTSISKHWASTRCNTDYTSPGQLHDRVAWAFGGQSCFIGVGRGGSSPIDYVRVLVRCFNGNRESDVDEENASVRSFASGGILILCNAAERAHHIHLDPLRWNGRIRPLIICIFQLEHDPRSSCKGQPRRIPSVICEWPARLTVTRELGYSWTRLDTAILECERSASQVVSQTNTNSRAAQQHHALSF